MRTIYVVCNLPQDLQALVLCHEFDHGVVLPFAPVRVLERLIFF